MLQCSKKAILVQAQLAQITHWSAIPEYVTMWNHYTRTDIMAQLGKPTSAFIGASWAALFLGVIAYMVGLWNATMPAYEKGYYFVIILYGLYSAVSLQKSVRDRMEGIRVTNLYYGLSWTSVIVASALLAIGLWNAQLAASEKGFYGMAFVMSLFAAVTVQKNVRDVAALEPAPQHDNHIES